LAIAHDLTDIELARRLGKHPRTVQRWCKAGKLPGAYKAGRSWRIPRRSVREAGLGMALRDDDGERELRAATLVCRELSAELDAMRGPPQATPPVPRNWRAIARRLEQLESALQGLPKLARDFGDRRS
jgi:excisionase family DNA binding protein